MSPGSRPSRAQAALLLAVGLATSALAVVGGGHPGAVVVPVLAVALVHVLWRAPLRTSLGVLFFLVLIAESPEDYPADGLWRSPLYFLGTVLLQNLSLLLGLPALPFSGLDLLLALLLAVVAFRRLGGTGPDAPSPVAGCVRGALAVYAFVLVALFCWGLARGGDAVRACWQLRPLVLLVVFGVLMNGALRGPGDFVLLGRLFVAAASVKAAVGLGFYFLYCVPRGLRPEYITTHTDTVLFLGAGALVLAHWLEAPGPVTLRRCLWVLPPLGLAVFYNDRRIAYVEVLALLLLFCVAVRSATPRRLVLRAGLVAVPLLALYTAVGWRSEAAFFRPLASLRTVSDGREDPSTAFREIENHNLARTAERHPLLGLGFGHPYDEVVRGPRPFELFRYYPHNSVLWLVVVGGMLGFPWLLVPYVVGCYLAARGYRYATRPKDRAAALGVLCLLLCFLLQAYGDMGLRGVSLTMLVATGLSVAGKLAVAVGAWPAPRPRPFPRSPPEPACPPAR